MNKANKILGLLIYILTLGGYWYISQKTEIGFRYNDGYEYLIGIIITTLIINLASFIGYKIAFGLTGLARGTGEIGNDDMRPLHWIIRFGLACLFFAIALLPFFSDFVTWLKDLAVIHIDDWLNSFTKTTTDAITSNW